MSQNAFGRALLAAVVSAFVLLGCAEAPAPQPIPPPPQSQPLPGVDEGLAQIKHIIVIYAENRSFDNLYGLYPGANGIANARAEAITQLDHDGKPLSRLPPVWVTGSAKPDPAFPVELENKPFRIDQLPVNQPLSVTTRDLVHEFYRNQEQINGGSMN